jgi:3'-phosphoadenosine 5'-phosphosulfate sulfotransferase (PAPS reductase)/FAD synthetase
MCYDIGSIPSLPKAVFSNTGVEMRASVEFVLWCKENYYKNIDIVRPKEAFPLVIKKYGKPMIAKSKSQFIATYQKCGDDESKKMSKQRVLLLLFGKSHIDDENTTSKFKLATRNLNILHPNFDIKVSDKCCYVLKKSPLMQYALDNDLLGYATGERNDEGGIRATSSKKRVNNGGQLCTKYKTIGSGKNKRKMIIKMPIIDWSNEMIQMFRERERVPLSKAYTEYGCKRTGCAFCPYAFNKKDVSERLEILYKYEPKMYKYAMATMKDVYIAQDIELPFDSDYEFERKQKWLTTYDKQRYEMIEKYRPEKANKYKLKDKQTSLF